MSRANKKDILQSTKAINILNNNKILIIGGGKASYTKLLAFQKKEFKVDVLSDQFIPEIKAISKRNKNVKLINGKYEKKYILDYSIIIIGTNNEAINREVADDCDSCQKIYDYLPKWENGKFTIPLEMESENVKIAISTRNASPKTSKFIGEKLLEQLESLDEFVSYVSNLRNNIKDDAVKKELMEFLNTDDFLDFFKAGKADLIIKTFYGVDFNGKNDCRD